MDRSRGRRRFLRAAAGAGTAVVAAGCSAPLDALRSRESPPGTIGDRDGRPADDGDRAWPRERFDAANGDLLWKSEVSAENVTHGGDRLYVDASTELAAVDPETGAVDWRREFLAPRNQPSLAAANDTVYAFDRNAVVSATDATDGGLEWDRTLDPREELLGPIVATDERILVVARHELAALEAATGTVAWRHRDDSDHGDPTVPTVAGDRVFLPPARSESALVCLDLETGDERWRREIEAEPAPAPEPPLAVGDGVYYVLEDGGLLAVSHDGEVRWRNEEHSVDSLRAAAGNRLFATVVGEYRQRSLCVLEG